MLLSIAAAVAALILSFLWLYSRRPKGFPPGPRGLPFLGSALSFGNKPELTLLKWKAEYGDVVGLSNGRQRMVILNDVHTVRRVFSESEVATGRLITSEIRTKTSHLPRGTGLVTSEGSVWKSHRRFAMSTLRDLGMGKNWLEDTVIVEVEDLCRVLADTNQAPFDPKPQLTNSVSNIICALIFGKRFDLEDQHFSRLTQLLSENVAALRWDFFAINFPFLMWFPNPIRTHVLQAREDLKSLVEFLQERVKDHDLASDNGTDTPDYLFAYRRESNNCSNLELRNTFNEPQLLCSLFDLFSAGTETVAATILWGMVFMIENPEVMHKIQEEIDSMVDRRRVITTFDRGFLPYTEAAIMEIQRCASIVPLGVFHRSLGDILVDGYVIPEDSLVIANVFSIHRDARYWKSPEKFNPMRFLDVNKKLLRPDGYTPFLIGKRACLGEGLAKMELFLFIANLLRCFSLSLPAGKTLTHDDYVSSIINSPLPFELIFTQRL